MRPREQPPCPVACTVDPVGDKWTLIILRDAFNGWRRFDKFQRSLGVAKNILNTRLPALVDAEILRTEPASDSTSYRAYVLTEIVRTLP
jgi:DNA-binding HxlR family transcriptional regulator